jgi:hypothetical protein
MPWTLSFCGPTGKGSSSKNAGLFKPHAYKAGSESKGDQNTDENDYLDQVARSLVKKPGGDVF